MSKSFLFSLMPRTAQALQILRRLWLFPPGVVFLLLCVLGVSTAMAGDVWIKSFTGQPAGTAPNGYRYDVNLYTQDIQIFLTTTPAARTFLPRSRSTAVPTSPMTASTAAEQAVSMTPIASLRSPMAAGKQRSA